MWYPQDTTPRRSSVCSLVGEQAQLCLASLTPQSGLPERNLLFVSIMTPQSVPGLSVPVGLFSITEKKNIDGRVGES